MSSSELLKERCWGRYGPPSGRLCDFVGSGARIIVPIAAAAGMGYVHLRCHRMLTTVRTTTTTTATMMHRWLGKLRMLPVRATAVALLACRRPATVHAAHLPVAHLLHPADLLLVMAGRHHHVHPATVRLGQPAGRWILLAVLPAQLANANALGGQ
uniref:Uncharacterized protein n=1 Tax=Anopheles merus TaxID=30066 RepID=A0A182UNP9_ANOME